MHPAERAVRDWLQAVVIGLELCPFAAAPLRAGRVRFSLSAATTEAALWIDLDREIDILRKTPANEIETTLLILPQVLEDFGRYTAFLEQAEEHLALQGWAQDLQIASFHPDYQFTGTLPDEPGNLSNRSPAPLLHLLREDSVSLALARHPDVEGIPAANVRRLEAMPAEERAARFPWLRLHDPR
jgi:uncharacterized protein